MHKADQKLICALYCRELNCPEREEGNLHKPQTNYFMGKNGCREIDTVININTKNIIV